MAVVRIKDGVRFDVVSSGGIRILAALDFVAQEMNHDVTITSGSDGEHSGPQDPHKLGRAYDVRTKDFSDGGQELLNRVKVRLGDELFFAWIEDAGQENEHCHIQVRHGRDVS